MMDNKIVRDHSPLTHKGHRNSSPWRYGALLGLLFTLSAGAATVGAGESDSTKRRFNNAVVEYKKGRLNAAEGILVDLLADKPNLHRARAELAIVQFKLGKLAPARDNIQRLLRTDGLPTNVVRNLHRLRHNIDKKLVVAETPKRHALSGAVQAYGGYDSNVALGGLNEVSGGFADIYEISSFDEAEIIFDDDLIYEDDFFLGDDEGLVLGNLPIDPYDVLEGICGVDADVTQPCNGLIDQLVAAGYSPTEFHPDGFVVEGGEFVAYEDLAVNVSEDDLESVVPRPDTSGAFVGQKLNLRHDYVSAEHGLKWRNDVSMTSETPVELDDFDKRRLRLDSHLLWRLNKSWLASGKLYYSHFKNGRLGRYSYTGVQPEISYLNKLGKFTLRTDLVRMTTESEFEEKQNSNYRALGLSWSKLFGANGLLLKLDTGFAKNESDDDFSDFSSNIISASALYPLSDHWELQVMAKRTFLDFVERPSMEISKYQLGFSYTILGGWRGTIGWEYNNIDAEYHEIIESRNVAKLGLVWQF